MDYEYLPQSAEEYLKQQETLERAKERQEEYEDLENQLNKIKRRCLKRSGRGKRPEQVKTGRLQTRDQCNERSNLGNTECIKRMQTADH